MKHIVSLCMAAIGLSSLATASAGTPDTWTLVSNTDAGRYQYVASHEGGFMATSAGYYPDSFAASNWCIVTGASTNDPGWDTVYENICINTWSDSDDLSGYAARTLSSVVDTDAPYIIYPPNTGPGGGA